MAEHYTVALAVYALKADTWGLAPEEHGPCGWAAVVRKGDRCAEYRQHACYSTRAAVTEHATATIRTILFGREFFFVTETAGDQAKKDLERARALARQVALVPDEPHMEIVA